MHPAAPSPDTRIVLSGVTKRFDDRVVLDQVSLTVRPGERIGVVGDNGSGKSTLLRLLAGAETPDNGTVTVHSPGGLGHLAQTLDLPPTARVRDAVDLALADVRALERRIEEAETRLARAGADPAAEELAAYGELLAAHDARGGRDADRRVDTTLHHLGERAALDRDRPLGTLSGGQRSRLALAAALAADPELLLLDEPTNDLDDTAVAWLEDRLRRHRGTVVAVTHDRVFLDRVTTAILEVDQDRRTVRRYGNGYGGYLTGRTAARARREREYEEWRAETARYSALAESHIGRLAEIPRKVPRGFSGAGAFRARSRTHGAMSRIRAAREQLHRLAEHPVAPPPPPLRFTGRIQGPATVRTPGTVSVPEEPADTYLDDVRVEGRLHVDALRIAPGERLLVTGPNGAGKTTLLRLLAGDLTPDSGTVRRPGRVGWLRQDTGTTDERRTAREVYGDEGPNASSPSACSRPATWPRPYGPCPPASAASWNWPNWWAARPTCSSSTSPRTTWPRLWSRRSRRPSHSSPALW
ncbi:ABC transporter ATP-binding protein [Streptomyces purpureus]|uniref:ABC transporter ATP-binding protein n=1 Tax=Streptomyces purpureus TaxID=1951 RepID=A0A918HDZ0_9ACTN|nr:ABC transporter ATP-binding protein [Streptomyces purpureus]